MTAVAPTLQAFFTQRLAQRRASPPTVAAHRDGLRLLLGYVARATGVAPCQVDIEDLNAIRIGAFLDHLAAHRHVSVATRYARLAAIHSLFRFAAPRHPEHAATISRVLAIPPKRDVRAAVCFLTVSETEAVLAAPDRSRPSGRRDHAMLLLAARTGLRVSELTGLPIGDVAPGTGAHVVCEGKGRKQRAAPLTTGTVAVLRVWLAERGGGVAEPLFPGPRGSPLTRDAVPHLKSRAHMPLAGCAADRRSHFPAHASPRPLRQPAAQSRRPRAHRRSGGAESVRGLPGVTSLHPPAAPPAAADLDHETGHHRTRHHRHVLLELLGGPLQIDRSAALTGGRQLHGDVLVDVGGALAVGCSAVLRPGPSPGPPGVGLGRALGERG